MLVCHIATPEELRIRGALNGGVGNPQDSQQDRASALSWTEERCVLRLPDHCVSVGWAQAPAPGWASESRIAVAPRHPLASSLFQGLSEKNSLPLPQH